MLGNVRSSSVRLVHGRYVIGYVMSAYVRYSYHKFGLLILTEGSVCSSISL